MFWKKAPGSHAASRKDFNMVKVAAQNAKAKPCTRNSASSAPTASRVRCMMLAMMARLEGTKRLHDTTTKAA